MTDALDFTHDPKRRSWVDSANEDGCEFPVQNLPFGVFSRGGETPRVGIAIGDRVLDVAGCLERGLFADDARAAAEACAGGTLNGLMALGRRYSMALRHRVSDLLSAGSEDIGATGAVDALVPEASRLELHLPAMIGDYTDFYASVHHATNVGSMFRPDNPLLPNYKWIPVGYHGRASSVVVSGTDVRRPSGQTKADDAEVPSFGPCRLLDYELEVGFFVGHGNHAGDAIDLADAERHMFGLCLVNDWSARDIQKWEYQPLGPFLSKSFATTISPWIVTLEALAPFRCRASERPAGDPRPLSHLADASNEASGGIDLQLEVLLQTQAMRESGAPPARLSRANFREMYWTVAQMVTHHASNGCNLRSGDLLASGTVSGPEKGMRGCLLELTWRGSEPVELPGGETRRFLQDGDEIVLRGRCEREGAVSIGFGECRGRVVPAAEGSA